MLVLKIDEKAEITNRQLLIGLEAMKPEDYFWLKDRFNLMKTFREQIWHFKTSAFMLQKRELEDFQILDLLKELNKVQSSLLKKINKSK